MFDLKFTDEAKRQREALKADPARTAAWNQVKKSLGYLQTNPRHPSLNTHEYSSMSHPWDPKGKVFEAYAQNNTPSAYRVFWCYGPAKKQITIIAITPHP
ncbi:MAG: hypothetical protein A3C35_02005 [Omnitrophica bacterium RIFCSPHIGHO2_02_FULL_46_11]|nr:MAG: hypothetical protein A3C35_02005 [Omnitrophica bacterium RIFCSPHIGHO2_02_FULL_46_11]OGW87454.1 MAG: hypothetical protein A3A81_05780 [Omnitrophica bacterium RIFCSPLOWO2_01_FULL_45_10b]